MKLRYKMRFSAYIIGPKPESLNLKTSFEYKGQLVRVALSGDDKSFSLDNADPKEKYFKRTKELLINIEIDPSTEEGEKLVNLIEAQDKDYDLVLILGQIANRVLRSIRNFGLAPHIYEIKLKPNEATDLIYDWSVEVSEDGKEYRPLKQHLEEEQKDRYLRLLARSEQDIPEIRASSWPEIEEAVQDDIESPSERELLTNAIEFLRKENFRMAILESVTCLEIVLTQYLFEFLSKRQSLSNKRVKNFLSPNLGLTNRVSVLLCLTVNPGILKNVNMENVLTAVEWRNGIVHKTGRLPNNIGDDDIRKAIQSVLGLALTLDNETQQIVAEPFLKEISQSVSEAYKIPRPTIRRVGSHGMLIKVQFLFDKIPKKEVLEDICKEFIDRFKNRDGRFDQNRHFTALFIRFPNKTVARWQNGKLDVYDKERK